MYTFLVHGILSEKKINHLWSEVFRLKDIHFLCLLFTCLIMVSGIQMVFLYFYLYYLLLSSVDSFMLPSLPGPTFFLLLKFT